MSDPARHVAGAALAVLLALSAPLSTSIVAVRTAQAASDAPVVGAVELIRFWGYGRPPGAERFGDLFARDPVVFGETLRTPEDAAIHVRFEDGSDLRIGENTELEIDAFVYDPSTSTGEMTLELLKGVLRFISGRMKEDRVTFVTPVATVGILGTDVWIEVLADGTTVVDVKEGRVSVTPRAGGETLRLEPGVNALIDGATGAAKLGPRVVSRDPGLTEDAGTKSGEPSRQR